MVGGSVVITAWNFSQAPDQNLCKKFFLKPFIKISILQRPSSSGDFFISLQNLWMFANKCSQIIFDEWVMLFYGLFIDSLVAILEGMNERPTCVKVFCLQKLNHVEVVEFLTVYAHPKPHTGLWHQ